MEGSLQARLRLRGTFIELHYPQPDVKLKPRAQSQPRGAAFKADSGQIFEAEEKYVERLCQSRRLGALSFSSKPPGNSTRTFTPERVLEAADVKKERLSQATDGSGAERPSQESVEYLPLQPLSLRCQDQDFVAFPERPSQECQESSEHHPHVYPPATQWQDYDWGAVQGWDAAAAKVHEEANMEDQADQPGSSCQAPSLTSPGIPDSFGTALCAQGLQCQPCMFYRKAKGCHHANQCHFCHVHPAANNKSKRVRLKQRWWKDDLDGTLGIAADAAALSHPPGLEAPPGLPLPGCFAPPPGLAQPADLACPKRSKAGTCQKKAVSGSDDYVESDAEGTNPGSGSVSSDREETEPDGEAFQMKANASVFVHGILSHKSWQQQLATGVVYQQPLAQVDQGVLTAMAARVHADQARFLAEGRVNFHYKIVEMVNECKFYPGISGHRDIWELLQLEYKKRNQGCLPAQDVRRLCRKHLCVVAHRFDKVLEMCTAAVVAFLPTIMTAEKETHPTWTWKETKTQRTRWRHRIPRFREAAIQSVPVRQDGLGRCPVCEALADRKSAFAKQTDSVSQKEGGTPCVQADLPEEIDAVMEPAEVQDKVTRNKASGGLPRPPVFDEKTVEISTSDPLDPLEPAVLVWDGQRWSLV